MYESYDAIDSSDEQTEEKDYHQDCSSSLADEYFADIRRSEMRDEPQPSDGLPPAPTEQQIQAMYAEAAQGRFNEAAGISVLRAFGRDLQNGQGNLSELSSLGTAINAELARRDSNYRTRLVEVRTPNSAELNIYMLLQRNGENLEEIIADVHRNGANSPYRNRAIRINVTTQPQGTTI